jgi:integrase
MEKVLEKYKRLDPVNLKIFADYLRHQKLNNLGEKTIVTKLFKVYAFLIWSGFRDIRTTRPEDIENFYLQRKSTKSPATAYGDLQELRVFFKWLLPDKEIITFRPQRPRPDIPPEKVIGADQVRDILACCESQRDRALVSIYWDSAARLNEILDCNIGHVRLDQYGAVISVNGKTGRRNIRLISSVPDLQAHLNIHPLKADPNAPLFVTSRKKGTATFQRMNERTVDNLFKRLGSYIGSGKRTNPHSFRHGRLTQRGKQLTESELRQYAGWSSRSSMAAVYVHLSSRDIDNKILTVDGVRQDEESARDPMAPVICPRCKKSNASDAMFCDRCSMTLSDEGIEAVGVVQNLMSNPDDLIAYAVWRKRQA